MAGMSVTDLSRIAAYLFAAGAIHSDLSGAPLRLDGIRTLQSCSRPVPEKVHLKRHGGGHRKLPRGIKWRHQQHKVRAVVRRLYAPLVSLPCQLEFRIAAIPGVGPGEGRALANRGRG